MPEEVALPEMDETTWRIYREAARQQLAIDTLAGFVRYMWDVLEPGRPLIWSWYLELICDELDGLARGAAPDGYEYGEDAELVVCMPPGHGKSRLCSVFFPAWLWLHVPHLRLLTVANEGSLATRDSKASRTLVLSDKFQILQLRLAINRGEAAQDLDATQREGRNVVHPVKDGAVDTSEEWKPWALDADQAAKVNFETSGGGGRQASGITARTTGKRADALIVDDPHDAREILFGDPARIVERLKEGRTAYHGALASRLNAGAWRLVVTQRLHAADLAGDLIDRGARVVCIPLHGNPEHEHAHPRDQREPGELLAPKVFSEERAKNLRPRMLPRNFDAQYEQVVRRQAGTTFNRAWFNQTYQAPPLELARRARFNEVAISVDCTFRETKRSDFVAATVWGNKRKRVSLDGQGDLSGLHPGKYLLDFVFDRMGLIATCAMLRRLRAKWSWARLVLVEARANGDAVIETLRREGHPGVVGYEPDRSKVSRAEVAALAFESGEVWLPSERYVPLIGEYVDQMVGFPAAAHDDLVDSTSQIFDRWAKQEIDDVAGELAWISALIG